MGTVGKEFQGNDMLNLLSWENPVRLKGETALLRRLQVNTNMPSLYTHTLCTTFHIYHCKVFTAVLPKKNALNKLVSKLWTVNAPVNQSGFKISRFISVTVQAGK